MQDIPRNELLDKLASGWKVRTKAYGKNTLNNLEELQGIDLKCLIQDDWEGEPPLPELKTRHCYIAFAFDELKNHKAKFIRRAAWKPTWQCTFDANHPIDLQKYELSLDDILSSDWEVWE
jgi:hypothetical protein